METNDIIDKLCLYLDDNTAKMIGLVSLERYEEATILRDNIEKKVSYYIDLLLKQKDLIEYSKDEITQSVNMLKEKYHEEYSLLLGYIKERNEI